MTARNVRARVTSLAVLALTMALAAACTPQQGSPEASRTTTYEAVTGGY